MYPKIEKAYRLSWQFRNIYQNQDKQDAIKDLISWAQAVSEAQIEHFNIALESIRNHWKGILNFFDQRSTNAHAVSLNAQLKLFRANLRGVSNVKLFLFRIEKIFA